MGKFALAFARVCFFVKIPRLFFDSLDALTRFMASLDCQSPCFACARCGRCDQFVRHDFVYKKGHHGKVQCVGKRLFCSNRNGRSGCGATLRLYLASRVPRLFHGAAALTAFVMALIAGLSIGDAYRKATLAGDPRNAYRWLDRLERKLIDFRAALARRIVLPAKAFALRTRRLQLLLPTIEALVAHKVGEPLGVRYQLHLQRAFV